MRDGFTDLGFARVDTDRRRRCGFPEVIFGQGKTPEQVAAIAHTILQADPVLLVSRATSAQHEAVVAIYPEARWHAQARCITVERTPLPRLQGKVAIVAAMPDLYMAVVAMGWLESPDVPAQLVWTLRGLGVVGVFARFISQAKPKAGDDA